MRILFLSQLLPLPLDAGPKIRSYHVIRHLAQAGHEITLVCFVRPTDRESDIREIAGLCRHVELVPLTRSRVRDLRHGLASAFSDTPFLILRDRAPAMDRRLEQLLGRGTWDAIHADQLWMAPYAARWARGQVTVLDEHNAVFRIPERLAANQRNPLARFLLRREAAKLAAFESRTLARFDHVVWVTHEDREAFPRIDGRGPRDVVIPIAVDPHACQPVSRRRPLRVTFLGGMHWPPNAEAVNWFADRVWPRVAAAVPDCVFTVIGRGAPRRFRSDSRISVTGPVRELGPYLAETAAFVVPLLAGAGMRVKILDAWCHGLPVVSTSIGAEGIRVAHGESALVADDPADFAECVISVLRDPALASRLSAGGRATVEALYDWRKVYRAWDSIYP